MRVLMLLVLLAGVYLSCANYSTNSNPDQVAYDPVLPDSTSPLPPQPLSFSDVKNRIWYFEGASINGQYNSAADYKPFILVLNSDSIYGYDGCNWYWGNFKSIENSFLIERSVITQAGCFAPVFPVAELHDTLKATISNKRIIFSNDNKEINFTTPFISEISELPVIEKNWRLVDSDAPNFERIRSDNLAIKLQLNSQHLFSVQWQCWESDTTSSYMEGFLGVGEDNSIFFWMWYQKKRYCRVYWLDSFIYDLLKIEEYSLEADTLRLFEKKNNYVYKFTL